MSRMSVVDAEQLALSVLAVAGFGVAEARPAAEALVLAERDGLASHGLARLPFYIEQARAGKVSADAVPSVEVDGAVVRVDARYGLAFAAIARGLDDGLALARKFGLAAVAIGRSHHFGVAGHPVERIAREGLIGLAFSNSPAAMAPWGGRRALLGTNPIAFGAPRDGRDPLVIDLSLSRVARGKVMIAKKSGRPIPDDWALDAAGRPTTDPSAALNGTMVPAGDAKGAALALMVELLCAGLTGSNFAYEASSFFDADGAPPGIAHLILVLDPDRFGGHFSARAEDIFAAIEAEDGARLPGERRFAGREDEIDLPDALVTELAALAGTSS